MICEGRFLLEVPYCCIRVSGVRRIEVCIDAHFPPFLERRYRVAFMIFPINDVQSLKGVYVSTKAVKLESILQCKNIASIIADAYLDAKSTILSSSRKLYYTQLLRLVGPIILSRLFRDTLSSEEEDVIEAGRAASTIESVFGRQPPKSTNINVIGEKSAYLTIAVEANNRVELLEGPSTVIKNYKHLYDVDKGFRRRINEIACFKHS